jgi:sugar-specific transcriptional regulator TrmB
MINTLLSKLGFNDQEISTYLFVLDSGEQTAGFIAQRLGLPRPSLYGYLKKLEERGVITESRKNGVKTFIATPVENIKNIFDQQIDDLKNNKAIFEKLLPEMMAGSGKTLTPKFQLFEGRESVKNIIKDALLYRNMETESYWPIKAMMEVLGADFFKYLNKERIKRNIYVKAIWPDKQKVDIKRYPYLGVGDDFLREIRTAPKETNFEMGYWIYGNKVLFISSKKECFGFIIESAEFTEMMKSQFNHVWEISKTIRINPKYTENFIQEVNK